MESGLSTPHEWQATGGVEVKGKGTMDTFLFLPDAVTAAAVAAPPSNGSAAVALRQPGMQQLLSTCDPQASEQMFRLMEASSSVRFSRPASRTATGIALGGDVAGGDDDDDVGTAIGGGAPLQRSLSGMGPASRKGGGSAQMSRHAVFDLFRRFGSSGNAAGSGVASEPPPPPPNKSMLLESLHEDRPSLSSEESPFSVVGEMMSALRAAQQSQQHNAVSGSQSTSQVQDAWASPLSAGDRSSAPDRKSPLGKTTTSSSHVAGVADGGGSMGSSRAAPSAWRPLDAVDANAGTAAATGAAAAAAAASSNRYNIVHGSGGGGSGSLSAALMEALGSTTAATRRRGTAAAVATAATAAADAAAVRRRGSNTGALTCFPTSLS